MNIFVLDTDPQKAAEYHCDKHVVKMVLETAQLLSNCVRLYLPNEPEYRPRTTYRHSHLKHPSSLWVRESSGNFEWLYRLGIALSDEYNLRFGNIHKSKAIIQECWRLVDKTTFLFHNLKPFPQVMPDQYKVPGDPVQAYRNYYIGSKASFATWKRGTPPWWPYSVSSP